MADIDWTISSLIHILLRGCAYGAYVNRLRHRTLFVSGWTPSAGRGLPARGRWIQGYLAHEKRPPP